MARAIFLPSISTGLHSRGGGHPILTRGYPGRRMHGPTSSGCPGHMENPGPLAAAAADPAAPPTCPAASTAPLGGVATVPAAPSCMRSRVGGASAFCDRRDLDFSTMEVHSHATQRAHLCDIHRIYFLYIFIQRRPFEIAEFYFRPFFYEFFYLLLLFMLLYFPTVNRNIFPQFISKIARAVHNHHIFYASEITIRNRILFYVLIIK